MLALHAPPHLLEEGQALVAAHPDLEGHLFATSGTTAAPKWILHSQAGLDWCADTVNAHFHCSSRDVWGLALPEFHVGGYCLTHRAARAGGRVAHYSARWNVEAFVEWLAKEEVTLTSLVPTQVFDLVAAGLKPPSSLRIALIGGDHLDETTYLKARKLDWPLTLSYGMTETAGLVACSSTVEPILTMLSGWQLETDFQKTLTISGPGLFAGFLTPEGFQKSNNPFHTTDRAELSDGELTLLGRTDDQVKILGELVDLLKLRQGLAAAVTQTPSTVVALPDSRRGYQLFAVFEGEPQQDILDQTLQWNETLPPFARIERPIFLTKWGRTALGKIDRTALAKQVSEARAEV